VVSEPELKKNYLVYMYIQ